MFQAKHSLTESNPTNLDPNTTLPNNYGSIRTLKDDIENFKSGKKELSEEPFSQTSIPQPLETHPEAQPKIEARPSSFEQKISPSGFSAAQKGRTFPEIKKGNQKSDLPSPFGSETFFQTQSPFDEKLEAPKKEPEKAPSKPSNKLVIVLSLLLVLAILSGGAYYWWFFVKSPKEESAKTAQKTAVPSGETATKTETTENQNVKQWSLDLEADKIANKLAIERYVKSLAGTISQNKAVEIKLVSKDNQLVTSQKFSEIFDFTFPLSISDKLTSDYSLFVFYENSESHLGAAFKLSQPGNLAESLKSEEGDLFLNLKSFYLDKLPADIQATFNSSKYKNADIRYFNFPSPPNTSLDYTVLSDKENSYFIFSTSKNSLRAILDYMSEK